MGVLSDAAVPQGNLFRKQAEQDRKIAAVSVARTGEHSSVTAGTTRFSGEGGVVIDGGGNMDVRGGGGVTVTDDGDIVVIGGNFRALNLDGTTHIAFFGTLSDGDRSWRLGYNDGRAAAILLGDVGHEYVAIYDQSDGLVFSTDGESTHGLARPYLNYRLVPSPQLNWPESTSTSAGTALKLWQGINPIWHPRVSIGILTSQDAGTAHWRLDIDGTTVEADSTAQGVFTYDVPGWGSTVLPGERVGIDVFGWVTGGGTAMRLSVDRLYGTESGAEA